MKTIKIDRKEYVVLPRQELNALLDHARATSYVDTKPYKPLRNEDLTPTECRFIEKLREHVKMDEKLIVRLTPLNGTDVSIFRFHLRDIKRS